MEDRQMQGSLEPSETNDEREGAPLEEEGARSYQRYGPLALIPKHTIPLWFQTK